MRRPFTVYRRRETDVWWYSFRVGGRRFRGSTGVRGAGNQSEAAQEAGARWLEESRRQGAPPPDPSTVEQLDVLTLFSQFAGSELKALARKRSPSYASQIEADLTRHVFSRFEHARQITAEAWGRACDELHAGSEGRRALKLRTIQRITAHLRQFLRYCEKVGAIAAAPRLAAPKGEDVAREQAHRRALTRAERDRLLKELRKIDPRAARIYAVMFYTLLRKSTVERLTPRHVDQATGYLLLPAALLKAKKDRALYLHPIAAQAIKAELGKRKKIDPDRPIFGPFNYRDEAGPFWRAVRAAKIDPHGITPHHVARHTGATIAGNEGASLAELMALGTWETPAMAMRYLHVDAAQSRKAAERL